MLLALDVGNTNICIGCIEGEKILFTGRLSTDHSKTADEYAICYVVSVNGSVSAFTTATEYAAQPGDEVRVQSVNSHGALSAPSLPLKVSTGIEVVTAGDRKTQMHHIYNTLGQKVTTARQGVYIVDGQTVILK